MPTFPSNNSILRVSWICLEWRYLTGHWRFFPTDNISVVCLFCKNGIIWEEPAEDPGTCQLFHIQRPMSQASGLTAFLLLRQKGQEVSFSNWFRLRRRKERKGTSMGFSSEMRHFICSCTQLSNNMEISQLLAKLQLLFLPFPLTLWLSRCTYKLLN